jgi:TetR/AcrR family transcriptional regulator, repressor for neighboring sulfatase
VTQPKRIRRTPEDLRAEAMAAARKLIVEGSGEALTMRAVADEIGVTYPNLSHHFGSAAGLHMAVAEELVRELLQALDGVSYEVEGPLHDPRRVVDITFDLLDKEGLGRLMSWLARSDLEGITDRVRAMVDEHLARLEARFSQRGEHVRQLIQQVALVVTFSAYAESSVGGLLGEALGLGAEQRRQIVAQALGALKTQLTDT